MEEGLERKPMGAADRGCLPLPRSRAFWLQTTAEKALAHGRNRGSPRPWLKERARAMRADGGKEVKKMLGASPFSGGHDIHAGGVAKPAQELFEIMAKIGCHFLCHRLTGDFAHHTYAF